jgi:hypothetical protein
MLSTVKLRVSGVLRVKVAVSRTTGQFFASNFAPVTKYFYAREELTEIGDARLSPRQVGTNQKDRKLQIMHERFSTGADSERSPSARRARKVASSSQCGSKAAPQVLVHGARRGVDEKRVVVTAFLRGLTSL